MTTQRPLDASWHALPPADIVASLQTDPDHGLTQSEVQARLARFGRNVLTRQRSKSRIRLFLDQLRQSLVLILLAAGIVTAALGEWVDSGVIFGVVVINSIVGFMQEVRAIKAIAALNKVMNTEATVLRDGARVRLSADGLVPGDVVVLQAGDKVPADIRLTYSRDLHIDESTLTGESLPAEKADSVLPEDTLLADRSNMAYASTLCSRGQGTGLVVATGDSTEVGNISHLISEAHDLQTPLTMRIAQLSRLLLFVIVGLAVITALVGILRGEPVFDMFMAAVALAVGAIPEGLPAAVTIVLSIGVSRMAKRRAIIRRLPAVETLGGTTVICSDKTGTLTENQMTVERVALDGAWYQVTGRGYAPEGTVAAEREDLSGAPPAAESEALFELFRAGMLCNDSSVYFAEDRWQASGDPTEAALVVSAAKAGIERERLDRAFPRLDTLPFESEHQFMATLHSTPAGERIAYVKGSTERLLARSATMVGRDGNPRALDRGEVESWAGEMASTGLRVLAFASKRMPSSTEEITHGDVEDDLVFLGLQGMIDPPRQEAIRAVAACHRAGIDVKMITGDHALTATAIARKLQLAKPGCAVNPDLVALTGSDLERIADDDLGQAAEDAEVFARVTPEQKLRLVTALQKRGHVVAMTGDGVNDGPALRQANIGIAMGRAGTEVAKEAADMVLTDDNFASIEAAVEEGRGVFDNLTKFITWTLPTNIAEGLVVLVAIFAGATLPLLPVQILWINMTTGVILGTTLALEAKEMGLMSRPPRPPQAPILDRTLLGRILIVGALLLAGAFGFFEYAVSTGHSVDEARTIAGNIIVLGELAFLFNCRSLTSPSWRVSLRTNSFLLIGSLIMISLQILYTYLPVMHRVFGTAAIDARAWAWIVAVAVVVHVAIELEKAVRRRSARKKAASLTC